MLMRVKRLAPKLKRRCIETKEEIEKSFQKKLKTQGVKIGNKGQGISFCAAKNGQQRDFFENKSLEILQ